MPDRPSAIQKRWQGAALTVLLENAGTYDRGPWIPAGEAIAATQLLTNCTHQAAAGSLRALLTVGLADSSETHEGRFWKATDAAVRANELQDVAEAKPE